MQFFQIQIYAKRCDFNQSHCENFETFSIPDLCKIIDLENQLWSDFMKNTEPKPRCPFNMPKILIKNATVDLGYVAYLPLDGYVWNFTVKTFKSGKARQRKQLLHCTTYDVIAMKNYDQRKNINEH